MENRVKSLSAAVAMIGVAAVCGAQQPTDAQAVLAAARQALGGEQTLSAIGALSVGGSHLRNFGDRNVDSALSIDCVLPDRFRLERTNTAHGAVSAITTTYISGFNGDELISEINSSIDLPPPPDINPPRTPEEKVTRRKLRVLSEKHAFARLALALFASSVSSYPLEFTYGGQVQLESGQADAVDAKGPDGFIIRVLIDAKTHLPVMIAWREATATAVVETTQSVVVTQSIVVERRGAVGPPIAPPMPPMPPPPTAPTVRASIPSGNPPIVEHQLSLGDYRTADGLTWPHRFTERVDGKVVQDMKLGKYRVNPKINPKRFNPSK